MAELKRDIRYIDRNFNDFRNTLINYSKTYFPDTYNDFTPDSTGMLFIEMASYVGDVLSFYLDNQVQETFIQYARETENLFNMAYMLGYEPKVTTVASVDIDFYQQLPAKVSGSTTIPDYDYALLIPENTTVRSGVNNQEFIIEDVIDFSSSSSLDPSTVTVYQISGNTPTTYLIKKTRKSISATVNTETFNFTSPVRFDTRNISDANIINILDVVDSDGNEWYEVPNLAQENVFDTIRNTNTNDPNVEDDGSGNDVPYLLQLKSVQRRFAARFTNTGSIQLQFGAGSFGDNDEEIIPNPDNVGLGLPFERDQLTTAFSPLNFVFTNTYGIAPSNTTLTVRYLTGGGIASNVDAGTLTTIDDTNVSFIKPNLNPTLANQIFTSIATNNVLAADGGQNGDTTEELRQNALGNYQTQLRTVTKEDYLIRALSMPSNLGSVAMAYAEPVKVAEYETGTLPSILDLYVLSYNINTRLQTASSTLKRNLKTYLSEYRMINDAINIKDAFIINIGINFDIVVRPNYNNNETLTKCIVALTNYFNIKNWQINQPIILPELNILLDKIEGVQTVKNIKVGNLAGEINGYSEYAYDVVGATLNGVIYPSIDPMVFELKFPNTDIKGRVVPL
jgi:hypothetical protein|tara:strand:- start:385 stop:2250 length:1866 start_codon:yes stop_codon:yes gene_type:complete